MTDWKTIPSYPNYEVSSAGECRNKSRGNILTWVDNGKGYQSVKLYNDQRPKGRLCLVHRVVLSTFSPETGEGKDVNHIDGDKRNNRLDNLEWVSKSENTRHAHITGLFSTRNKLSITAVRDIKANTFNESQKEMAERYGVRRATINKIVNGRLYGYV